MRRMQRRIKICFLVISIFLVVIHIFKGILWEWFPSDYVTSNPQNSPIGPSFDIPSVKRSLVFYTADLHDGIRMDIATVLAALGQEVILGGIKGNKINYPQLLNYDLVKIYKNLSGPIQQYVSHSTSLHQSMIQQHYSFYKDNSVIQSVDAFICSFPASMCQLWIPFNKTIIFLPAHRYNLGRCTAQEWDNLDRDINKLAASKKPKHFIAATNTYDVEYLNYYTGQSPILLENFSGFYTYPFQYKPTKTEILLYGRLDLNNFCPEIHPRPVPMGKLFQGFPLEKIVQHPAVVFIPYSVNSYKQTELYSVSMPLIMPSLEYFRTHPFGKDRTAGSINYCKSEEISSRGSHPRSKHGHNPNVEWKPRLQMRNSLSPEDGEERKRRKEKDIIEDELYWLAKADFYTRPHILHFDNCTHLEAIIRNTDFKEVHGNMKKEVKKMGEGLLQKWKNIIDII